MRVKGSVRFEPYYKLEVWDALRLAWRPIQKAHATEQAAEAAITAGSRARVYCVTEQGRSLIGEHHAPSS